MSAQQQRTTTKSIGNYILGKTIGEGTFGKVKLGRHILSGASVAVKVLQKDRIVEVADVERVAREVHILKLIRHPHIVQLFEIIETRGQLYLIMEYASGGELFDHIVSKGRVPELEACRFFHQIIAGVEKIHEMRVVHRDLKPENLLLDEHSCIKIVDFGLSNLFRDGQRLSTACGSPCYAPPEMVAGQQYVPQMCDLWSCGVILFALVCGYLPFEDQNTAALYKKILAADYSVPNFISDAVKDMIAGLLTVDPQKRFTIANVRAHPWYRQLPEASVPAVLDGKPVFDEDVLHELEGYGFPRDYAVRCLELNKHNHITTTYYLLLERKRRVLEQLAIPAEQVGIQAAAVQDTAQDMESDSDGKAISSTVAAAPPREMLAGEFEHVLQQRGSPVSTEGASTPLPMYSAMTTDAQCQAPVRVPRVAHSVTPGPGVGRESSGTPRCGPARNAQARRVSTGARPNTSPNVREQYSARGKIAIHNGTSVATPVATTPRTTSPWRPQQVGVTNPYSARGAPRGSALSDTYGTAMGAVGTATSAPWPRPQSTTPHPWTSRTRTSGVGGAVTPHSARGVGSKEVACRTAPDVGSILPWKSGASDRQTSTTPQATPRNCPTPRTAFTPRGGAGGATVGPRAATPQSTGAYRSSAPMGRGSINTYPTSEPRGTTLPSGVPGATGRNSVTSSRHRPQVTTIGMSAGPGPVRAGGTPTPRTRGVVYSR